MKFFFHPSPNPMKVALLLEELQTPYELIGVDTFKGEQHLPAFLAINPNAKVPALVDGDATVFDSQAILLHLAQKNQRFLPTSVAGQAELLSWLMFIATGLSPFSGQAVHFLHHAPEDLPYAKNRYLKEVERHYRVLDQRLADHQYLAGDTYSIADMALWGCGAGPATRITSSARTVWRPTRTSSVCSMKSAPARRPNVRRV
jgi:GST-like protein